MGKVVLNNFPLVFQVWAYDKDTVSTLSFLPNYQEQHVKRIPCLTNIQTILNLGTRIWPLQKKMVSKLRLPTIWSPVQIQTKLIPCHRILHYYDRLHLKVLDQEEPGKFKEKLDEPVISGIV